MKPYLSKSDYMKYLVHPAYLWLQKNDKKKLPPVTPNDQFVFDQGFAFEDSAQELFPNGSSVEAKPWEFDELIRQTENFAQADASEIFQATVRSDKGLLCKVDVLQRNEDKWNIYEIKGSTRLKDDHLHDVAFQKIALEDSGYEIASCNVIHINRDYIRNGIINPEGITQIVNVDEEVELLLESTKKNIEKALEVMKLQAMPDPNPVNSNLLHRWLDVYHYIYGEPAADSIYKLKMAKPWQLQELLKKGIESLDEVAGAIKLNGKQEHQLRSRAEGIHIDKEKISEFMNALEYPLYFLDYETAAYALPLYDRTRPYQQVPFQYSLHILDEPGGELRHVEYLHRDASYPVRSLLSHLFDAIGTSGSVLVWYAPFEKGCNRDMGIMEPSYHGQLEALNKRVVDLMDPFAKFYYVHPDFEGSSSIKKVMPVVAPDLSYKDLGIQEGGSAQREYVEIVMGKKSAQEAHKIYDDLVEYCGLDTYAMVRIYEELLKVALDTNIAQAQESRQQTQASLF